MNRRTADATEQWLQSLLQSLDAAPVPPLSAPATSPPLTSTLQRKSSPVHSTHEIRLGADQRLVTLTFTAKNATAPVPKPKQEKQEEWPGWLKIPVFVLGSIVGSVVIAVVVVVYSLWLGRVLSVAIDWLGI